METGVLMLALRKGLNDRPISSRFTAKRGALLGAMDASFQFTQPFSVASGWRGQTWWIVCIYPLLFPAAFFAGAWAVVILV